MEVVSFFPTKLSTMIKKNDVVALGPEWNRCASLGDGLVGFSVPVQDLSVCRVRKGKGVWGIVTLTAGEAVRSVRAGVAPAADYAGTTSTLTAQTIAAAGV